MVSPASEQIVKLNRLSAHTRIASALIFACAIATASNLWVAAFALLIGLGLLGCAELSRSWLLKRWQAVNVFVLFLWLFVPWSTPGEPYIAGWPLSRAGIELSFLLTLKINALFFFFVALISPMRFTDLARGFRALHLPDKLVAMLLFTARGIALLTHEYAMMVQAAKLRGFRMKTDRRTYRAISAMVAGLFIKALKNGELLQESMLLRGFDGKIRLLGSDPSKASDKLFLLFTIGVALLFAVGNFYEFA